MSEAERLAAGFGGVLVRLRDETGAIRCTVRLDLPALGWSVNTPCAEVLAPGAASMTGDGSIDHRRARSIRWIERHRRTLVQGDVFADPDMAPPPALSAVFGTRAQMVGPLVGEDDYLVGWVSAHFAEGPREFTPAERAAHARARAGISRIAGLPFAEDPE